MARIIISATVSAQQLRFGSGLNILWGKDAEDVVVAMGKIFGGKIPISLRAEIRWCEGITFGVFCPDGACFVDWQEADHGDPAQLIKRFHKQRFLYARNSAHILDGADLPMGFAGVSDLLLEKLRTALAEPDARPLFVCNFLERLDESIDLSLIFEALLATGRQVFIALPSYYPIKQLEELPYDTAIHTLRPARYPRIP